MKAGRKANALSWVGLGLMSVQFGVLARLTWFEYSWDVSSCQLYIFYDINLVSFLDYGACHLFRYIRYGNGSICLFRAHKTGN